MIGSYLELLFAFVQSGLLRYGFYELMWLAVVATVPYFIHALLFQKGAKI